MQLVFSHLKATGLQQKDSRAYFFSAPQYGTKKVDWSDKQDLWNANVSSLNVSVQDMEIPLSQALYKADSALAPMYDSDLHGSELND